MKNLLLVAILGLAIVPFISNAHTEDNSTSQESGFMMMQQAEDQSLGDTTHEEMEDLMEKMMSGTLTETEADRTLELMDQYPGPSSMMMGRMMGMGTFGHELNSLHNNSMMEYGMGGFNGGIFMILFWLLVIVGIFVLIKYAAGSDKTSKSPTDALDILKERYAKGEIDKEEFETKKKDLQ